MKINRQELILELENLNQTIDDSDFINPKDLRRVNQIKSLLMTNGSSDAIQIIPSKRRKPNRVTSFTRDKR